MIDLSVPRNIDPSVNELEGVFRFDIDDLQDIADQGKQKRVAAAIEAERMVDRESESAWKALLVETIHSDIGSVVQRAERIRAAELARVEGALAHLSDKERGAIDAMTRAIVKKVLHSPLSRARTLASEGNRDAVNDLLHALGASRNHEDDDA